MVAEMFRDSSLALDLMEVEHVCLHRTVELQVFFEFLLANEDRYEMELGLVKMDDVLPVLVV